MSGDEKQRKGGIVVLRGDRYARVRVGDGERVVVKLLETLSDEEARARVDLIVGQLTRLVEAHSSHAARDVATELAKASTPKRLQAVVGAVDQLCKSVAVIQGGKLRRISFREFAEQWTSGALARQYPDSVKKKKSSIDDEKILRAHINPVIGDIPLDRVCLEHGLLVMSRIPPEREPATRRHVAQVLTKVLAYAVYPGRHIAASPIPPGFLPKLPKSKGLAYLYPDEDERLLACTDVPLDYRILYGVLAREGMRVSEAIGNGQRDIGPLEWPELDLHRGLIRLDENKTDDPRAWSLDPGVVQTLRWQAKRGLTLPFGTTSEYHLADRFRSHLRLAGVVRVELFQKNAARRPIRAHDLRATFVTIALAGGKTETWVMDRTGHSSSAMLAKYRRIARTFEESGIGGLRPLNEAIPEIAGRAACGQQPARKGEA